MWCSPGHACLFLATHIKCSSGAYTKEKTCFKFSCEGTPGTGKVESCSVVATEKIACRAFSSLTDMTDKIVRIY